MKYNNINQKRMDVRIFRLILRDYLTSKERRLIAALPSLEKEVPKWLHRVGGLAGEW